MITEHIKRFDCVRDIRHVEEPCLNWNTGGMQLWLLESSC